MASLIQLNPHENMTVKQALGYAERNADEYQDVLIVGYDQDGALLIRSSVISRNDALFLLLEAIDYVRKVGRHAES